MLEWVARDVPLSSSHPRQSDSTSYAGQLREAPTELEGDLSAVTAWAVGIDRLLIRGLPPTRTWGRSEANSDPTHKIWLPGH